MSDTAAFIVATSKRIAPFDDPVTDVLIHHTPLRALQESSLRLHGLVPHYVAREQDIPADAYPCVVLTDDLYLSEGALGQFLKLARRHTGSSQCAILRCTAFAQTFIPFADECREELISFPLKFLRAANATLESVCIDLAEKPLPVSLPGHMRSGMDIFLPACSRPILRIDISADLLFANIAHIHIGLARLLNSPLRMTLAIARKRSMNPARVLCALNRIGRNCVIHPSAYLEGAVLGSGVRIGANAVIRMSSIGDNCEIGDGSVVKHSVVGPGSVLFDDLTLGFAVCYPETFLIHGPYHLSIFGRSSAMFATILDDFRIDGKPIRLERNGRLVPMKFPFMGSFIGHHTRVAGGCILAPGRLIPNNLLIVPPPMSVLSRIPPDAPPGVALAIHDGTLKEVAPSAKSHANAFV